MPRYDVILYSLHWLKFSGIDAATPRDAIQIAHDDREPDPPAIPEDAEDLPQEAIVDVVSDEEHEHSARFDLEFFDGQVIAKVSNECSMRDRALTLLRSIARMKIEGEIDPETGEEYEPQGNDDEIDALYSLIGNARAILGIPEPESA